MQLINNKLINAMMLYSHNTDSTAYQTSAISTIHDKYIIIAVNLMYLQ